MYVIHLAENLVFFHNRILTNLKKKNVLFCRTCGSPTLPENFKLKFIKMYLKHLYKKLLDRCVNYRQIVLHEVNIVFLCGRQWESM